MAVSRGTLARRWPLAALVLLFPLVGAEVGLRALIALDRLPTAAAHQRDFEISWANLHRGPPPDVLLLGDSVTQQGIEPAVLQELLGEASGRQVRVFNAAAPSANFLFNLSIVDELAEARRLPKVAIIGVHPGSMRRESMFEEVFVRTPMGRLTSDCAYAAGFDDTINCAAEQVSVLWRWRGRLDRAMATIAGVPQTSQHGGLLLRSDGFRSGHGVAEQTIARQAADAEARRTLHDVPRESRQTGAAQRLIDFLRNHDVTVVVVSIPNIPELEGVLERTFPGYHRRYERALASIETAADVHIVRPLVASWYSEGDARNAKHLSQRGATRLTRQLWSLADFRAPIMTAISGLAR